jgi:hypothetical protein
MVNARLPKGNLAAGNAGGADRYRGGTGVPTSPQEGWSGQWPRPSGRQLRGLLRVIRERDAPDAVVVPRHPVSSSASPMTGSSGVSSTPRLIGSMTTASGMLDPPSLVELRRTSHPLYSVEYVSAISRRDCARGLHEFCPSEARGRREDRVHAAPAVSCANCT